ncbi:hypothetical protein HMPREF0971_02058 [Segatella oris F0302]|uniref:Uncharacterized protein n=1 Tax=Segatella oris F0302 TaxID=649760 RepID=D1QSU7_9BACT|nr:hypothetical protein HMPREF0971_02058 [Segatella oris F0302]
MNHRQLHDLLTLPILPSLWKRASTTMLQTASQPYFTAKENCFNTLFTVNILAQI